MTGTAARVGGRAWQEARVGARSYERNLVPQLFAPWAQELVEMVGVRPGERVLDLACGTGAVARAAAGRATAGGRVTGVDVNGDMLEEAGRASGTARAITWRQADAHATGLPDRAFDVALCQQGLQFFADRPAVLRELHRVLVPGGRLGVSVWSAVDHPAYVPIRSALERHLPHAPEAAAFVRAIFALHDADLLHDLLAGGGFTDVRIGRRAHLACFASAEAWVRAFLGAAPVTAAAQVAGVQDRIVADTVAELDPGGVGDRFSFSMQAHVATARR